MGVKNLKKLEKDGVTLESLGKLYTWGSLHGSRIAIDANWLIYSSRVSNLKSEDGTPTFHISLMLSYLLNFKKHNIQSTWFFDGSSPEIKSKTLDARKSSGNRLQKDVFASAQKFLDLVGAKYFITTDGVEAEQHASVMCKDGVYNWVLSRDTDVLMFGGNLLVPEGSGKFTGYAINDILKSFSTTHMKLIEIGTALGTDYEKKVKGVSAKNAFKKPFALLPEHKKVIEHYTKPISGNNVDYHCSKPSSPGVIIDFLTSLSFKNIESKVMELIN